MKRKNSGNLKGLLVGSAVVLMVCGFAIGDADATNGDNLIGIGPIARSMGGVGVAAPQDAISAVFANPAGMCFGPYCPGSEFNFAGTVFSPTVNARVQMDANFQGAIQPAALNLSAESQADPYIVPAIGFSMPINPQLRFGLAAYGVSGLGVDYRDQLLATVNPNAQMYTLFQAMKFAPNIAYMVNDHFSVGASLHVGYAALDLGSGTSHGYTAGIQLGTIYKAAPFSFGLSYISPQKVTHERVYDFDGNGTHDDLDLESPQQAGIGIAYEPNNKYLIECDVKWLNWKNASGYEDFDWDNQWIYGIGAQYKPTNKLALRIGYNYAKNPVNEHSPNLAVTPTTTIQGKTTSTFGYEYLRIIGFPAIVESHLGLGVGYQVTDTFSLNLGYMHAFEKTMSETIQNGAGQTTTLSSDLKEDSIDFGLTMRF